MITASIVVNDSPPEQLRHAVECIRRAKVETIWIVFNGERRLRPLYDNIPGTMLVEVSNKGYGAGHNEAIRRAAKAGSDYHIVMNDDVEWAGDVISRLAEKMDRNTSIAMIAPEVRNGDGTLQYSCRMLPTPGIMIARGFLPKFMYKKLNDRYLLKDIDHSTAINSPYILGCFMMLRMDAVKACGSFDERFFMYPEDIDMTRRLHKKGKTLYEPSVSIIHKHRRASRKSAKMLYIHAVNMIAYFNKWGWFNDRERREFNARLRESLK